MTRRPLGRSRAARPSGPRARPRPRPRPGRLGSPARLRGIRPRRNETRRGCRPAPTGKGSASPRNRTRARARARRRLAPGTRRRGRAGRRRRRRGRRRRGSGGPGRRSSRGRRRGSADPTRSGRGACARYLAGRSRGNKRGRAGERQGRHGRRSPRRSSFAARAAAAMRCCPARGAPADVIPAAVQGAGGGSVAWTSGGRRLDMRRRQLRALGRDHRRLRRLRKRGDNRRAADLRYRHR